MAERVKLLKTLFEQVRQHDGVVPKIYWHLVEKTRANPWNFWLFDEEQLIAFFSAYRFKDLVIEITGMVHPHYRQQGIFRNFFEGFRLRNAEFKHYEFPCSTAAVSQHCMTRFGAEFGYAEQELQLDLTSLAVPAITPTSEFSLQRATPQQLNTLIAIDRACFATTQDASSANLIYMLSDKDRQTYLFFIKDIAVGKVHIRLTKQNEVVLHDIAILPHYQGQGWGKKMLTAALLMLAKQQFALAVVEAEMLNKPALSLYQQLGFKKLAQYDYYEMVAK